MAKTKVICDAGPLIHLDELGCIELLSGFDEILVPDEVWEEVKNNRSQALEYSELKRIKKHNKISDIRLNTIIKTLSLDRGESAALSLIKDYPGAIFLTDDSAARFAAIQMGIKVHGTIGIIIRSIRQNIHNPQEVISILQNIPNKSTLYIRKSLLDEIIKRIKTKFPE